MTNGKKGLKIVNVDLGMDSGRLVSKPRPRMLWDHEYVPSRGLQSVFIDLRRAEAIFRYSAGHRPAQYLSLEHIRSLTMFCSGSAVSCIQADDSKRRLGTPHDQSCAVTYFLRPGEFIQSLHVVTVEFRKDGYMQAPSRGPYILVRVKLISSFYEYHLIEAVANVGGSRSLLWSILLPACTTCIPRVVTFGEKQYAVHRRPVY